jgi:hypothetical protein
MIGRFGEGAMQSLTPETEARLAPKAAPVTMGGMRAKLGGLSCLGRPPQITGLL